MPARTAGELRTGREVVLPPVQMELFAEAGAVVATRLARARAPEDQLASVLRRAAAQAEHVCREALLEPHKS